MGVLMITEKTNWYDESLNKTYGHNNNGLIHGINYIENNKIIECAWFKTKKERDEKMLQEIADRNGF